MIYLPRNQHSQGGAVDFSIRPKNLTAKDAKGTKEEKDGGFDAVIGNPPYVLMQTIDDKTQFNYLSKNYESATYKIDTYQVFIEKALRLAKQNGYVGFITPNTFLRNKFAVSIRSVILKQSHIKKLRLFYYPVFHAANVDTLILVTEKTVIREGDNNIVEIEITENTNVSKINKKIQGISWSFGIYGTAYFGIQTHDRDKYVSKEQKNENWHPVIDGANIQNCLLIKSTEYVCCDKKAIKSGGE